MNSHCLSIELGSGNLWFVKASIWLTTNGNKKFREYDHRGVGIIDEEHLLEAMDLFHDEHWKYEGMYRAAREAYASALMVSVW